MSYIKYNTQILLSASNMIKLGAKSKQAQICL